jgi:hypothetical protein
VHEEVLVLGVVSPVHLGHCMTLRQTRRPARPVCVITARMPFARQPHQLAGHAGPDSVLGWASLLGRSGFGHCGAQLNSAVFYFLLDLF